MKPFEVKENFEQGILTTEMLNYDLKPFFADKSHIVNSLERRRVDTVGKLLSVKYRSINRINIQGISRKTLEERLFPVFKNLGIDLGFSGFITADNPIDLSTSILEMPFTFSTAASLYLSGCRNCSNLLHFLSIKDINDLHEKYPQNRYIDFNVWKEVISILQQNEAIIFGGVSGVIGQILNVFQEQKNALNSAKALEELYMFMTTELAYLEYEKQLNEEREQENNTIEEILKLQKHL